MLLAMHTAICLRFILTGKVSDYRCALALIDGIKTDALLADKGYNANYIVEGVNVRGIEFATSEHSCKCQGYRVCHYFDWIVEL
jgi:hypothetical protein